MLRRQRCISGILTAVAIVNIVNIVATAKTSTRVIVDTATWRRFF